VRLFSGVVRKPPFIFNNIFAAAADQGASLPDWDRGKLSHYLSTQKPGTPTENRGGALSSGQPPLAPRRRFPLFVCLLTGKKTQDRDVRGMYRASASEPPSEEEPKKNRL
jgi:hypothetical protein